MSSVPSTIAVRQLRSFGRWLQEPLPPPKPRAPQSPYPYSGSVSSRLVIVLIAVFFIVMGGVNTIDYMTGPDAECRKFTRTRSDGVVQHAAYYPTTLKDGSKWMVCRLGTENMMPPERIG